MILQALLLLQLPLRLDVLLQLNCAAASAPLLTVILCD